eukprot:gene20224-26254_t
MRFYDWLYLEEEDVYALSTVFDVKEIKKLIGKIFKINYDDDVKTDIAIEFYFYNYSFCKDKAFNNRKISTYLSIMHDIFIQDTESMSFNDNIMSSYQYFEELLLRHSIERPPNSIGIFSLSDVENVIDYTNTSYYGFFQSYKFIFGYQMRLIAKQ